MLLLKLHGSTNWRLRRGAARPYALDALVHDEAWLTLRTDEFPGVANDEVRDLIQRHLEPTPLLVPPVLMKTDLAQQPILRLVWALAFEALSAATRVTFIGYPLPITDIASAAMLGEALGRLDPSKIVVVGRDSARKNELMASYRRVFPELTDDRFRWDGAVAWAAEIAADSPLQAPLILPTG